MTPAVTSSTAAAYVTSASALGGPSDTGVLAQTASTTTATPAPPTSSVDTVTLSAAAQQALATAAAPQPDSSRPPAADPLQTAIAALNDTSGKTSTADQLQAYETVVNFVAGSSTASSKADPSAIGDATAALYSSSFGQHAQQLLSQIGSIIDWSGGDKTADTVENALATFDGLSTTDQQIYVGAIGLQHQLVSGETPIATVADYQANQQARADVERALQVAETNPAYASTISQGVKQGFYGRRDNLAGVAAAAGDQATVALVKLSQAKPDTADYTAQVQAYFAQYGPAPAAARPPTAVALPSASAATSVNGQALAGALAAVNDTSGKTAFTDQLSAYQTLSSYFSSGQDYGPARTAVIQNFSASAFFKQVDAAAQQYNAQSIGLVRSASASASYGGSSQAQLALLNSLSPMQQQLVFAGTAPPGVASLDAWKAQFGQSGSTGVAEQALKSLSAPQTTESTGDVALTLLQSAAKATANARAASDKGAGRPPAASGKTPVPNTTAGAAYQAAHKAGAAVSIAI
jgi:hypothetical protein